MGLGLTAYRGLTKIDAVFDSDGEAIRPDTREPISYDMRAWVNEDFPGRAGDIQNGEVFNAVETFSFYGGSYSAYNAWREELSKLAGYPAVLTAPLYGYGDPKLRHDTSAFRATEGPFWELICFSDCEGVIGSEVSAKLARDFAEFQAVADAHENEAFRRKYDDWRRAFEMAADGGAVTFR